LSRTISIPYLVYRSVNDEKNTPEVSSHTRAADVTTLVFLFGKIRDLSTRPEL